MEGEILVGKSNLSKATGFFADEYLQPTGISQRSIATATEITLPARIQSPVDQMSKETCITVYQSVRQHLKNCQYR